MQNSPISWLGGKRLLRKTIISKFPGHKCYVEVFGGGAWVLFGKDPSKVEVLNDIDGELINFYHVVKCCPHELLLELQWDLVSREMFKKYIDDSGEDDVKSYVKRAKNFYYIIKASFGGSGKHFGVMTTSKPKLNLQEVDHIIFSAHDRLKRVIIENLDCKDLIERHDREFTLFYLDPPYRTASSKSYHSYFKDEDYIRLNEVLRGINGLFIMSLNDDKFIRELFKGFRFEEVETRYSIMAKGSSKVKELLIMNY
jgi:DNA adenine methylase